MSIRKREGRENVEKILAELQVPRPWEFGTTGGSHQFVIFQYDGRPRKFFFASTSGDRRSLMNARASIKRVLREAPRVEA